MTDNLYPRDFIDTNLWITPAAEGSDRLATKYAYVAGPMTGIPGFNYPAFDAARDLLASEGWDVISPADLDRRNLQIDFGAMAGTEDLSEYVTDFARQDIAALLIADAVFLLEGWENSRGAKNEARIAGMLGVPVYTITDRTLVTVDDARFCQ